MKFEELALRMNLQTFATPYTNVTGDTGMSAEMKTFYKTQLLQFAQGELLFEKFGKHVPIPQNNGNSIEFRYMSPLPVTTTDLTEGVTPDGNKITMNAITESLHQIGYWVSVSDKLQWEAVDPIIAEVTKAEGRQAGKSIDTLIRDVVSAGSNVIYAPNYAGGSYTANVARSTMNGTALMTCDLLINAAAALEAQDAPTINGEYVAIMHPYVAADLQKTQAWQDAQRYVHPEKIYKGEIGSIGNIRVIKNTRAKIVAGAGATISGSDKYSIYCTMVLGADAYAVSDLEGAGLEHIVKPLGAGEDPLNQRSTVGWKAMRLAKRLIEQYMVRIETTSATNTMAAAN
jgi:N4-gp56 family major capsid protein